MKTCKDCHKEQLLSQFYKGQGECKDCTRLRVAKNRAKNIDRYRRYDKERQKFNPIRVFQHRYSGMKLRVEGKCQPKYLRGSTGKEICTREEFLKWCFDNIKSYEALFKPWADSGFTRRLTPSIDRIDNSKGYTINNMQWLPLHINSSKNK